MGTGVAIVRAFKIFGSLSVCALLLGCAAVIKNDPVNVAGTPDTLANRLDIGFKEDAVENDVVIGLSFSGGGTRAAAFSYGVLAEMERMPLRGAGEPMIERLDFISGVSGGAVTAAYYGLKKRAGLADFREKFLLRNAEENLQTDVSLLTLPRVMAGGINDSTGFPRWLDANLFHGANFGQFRAEGRPRVWINASDIYNRTPFVFGATSFRAMCSDLSEYPLADAVAASAAVPVAFAPVVIKTFPGKCKDPLPSWVARSRDNAGAPPMLSASAKAISRYHDGSMPYIKLLDGGLVDNYGLSGFTITRLSSETPYEPLTPAQAVKLRRGLFLVVDAKSGVAGNWINTVEGPTGFELFRAAADTAVDAGVAGSYTAFERVMEDWRAALVKWRCGLSSAERARLGARPGWNCRDLKFFIGRIGFDQFDGARAAELEAIPTRFHLPAQQVDLAIAAGGDAFRMSPVVRGFASGL